MKRIIYFITFFVFSGYYAGLAIIITSGFTDLSRFYSLPIRALTLICMIYVIKENYRNLLRRRNAIVILLMTAFWGLYFLKVLYHVQAGYPLFRSSWVEYIFYAMAFCVFPFFTYASIDFDRYKKTILDSLIFSGFILGLVCLYLYKDILAMGVGRINEIKYIDENAADTLNPLALSYGGVLTLVLCVYKIIYIPMKNNKERLYIYVTIFLSLILFFLGSSRGSMIALVTSAGLFVLYGSYSIRIKALFVTILSVPILIYGAYLSGSSIFGRIESTFESGDEGRNLLWTNAWNEFVNYPFLGRRIEIGFYPHNIFLETLMSIGIVGFLLFIIVLFKGYRRVWNKSKNDVTYLIPFIVMNQAVSQHMVTGGLYVAILLFFSLGLAFTVSNQQNNINMNSFNSNGKRS